MVGAPPGLSLGLGTAPVPSTTEDMSDGEDEGCSRVNVDLRIKNTFIHVDTSLCDSDDELTLPLKSVSVPSIKTHGSSTRVFDRSTPTSTFCMSPTMGPPHVLNETPKSDGNRRSPQGDVSKTPGGRNRRASVGDMSKTPKCLRFDFAPSFFGGNPPPDEDDNEGGSNQFSPVSNGSIQLPFTKSSCDSLRASQYTVKNTFVHLVGSRPDESDLYLPQRRKSEPAMKLWMDGMDPKSPVNGMDPKSPVWIAMSSDKPPSWPAMSSSSFHLEDDDVSSVTGSISVSGSVSSKAPQIPISFSLPTSFKVKNTFVEVESEDESDESLGLPNRPNRARVMAEQDTDMMKAPEPNTLPSIGAAKHAIGECKPCAWFWKLESCQWGAECQHCHLCPMGELRRRKKERRADAKEMKREAAALAVALSDTPKGS